MSRLRVAAVAFSAVLEAEVLVADAEGGAELDGHQSATGGRGGGEDARRVIDEAAQVGECGRCWIAGSYRCG